MVVAWLTDGTGFSPSGGASVLLLPIAVEGGVSSVWVGTDEGVVSGAESGEDDEVDTVSHAGGSSGCGLCWVGWGVALGQRVEDCQCPHPHPPCQCPMAVAHDPI